MVFLRDIFGKHGNTVNKGMFDLKIAVFLVFLICLFVVPCAAEIFTIDANSTGDYPTIQAAIDDANDGDTIILLPGRYTGDGNRDIDYLGKAITLRSTEPNDPNIVDATIIDCNGSEYERHRGFYFHNGEEPNSILAGITITNGLAPIHFLHQWYPLEMEHCLSYGGGIYCDSSSPTITRCKIVCNKAGRTFTSGIIYSQLLNQDQSTYPFPPWFPDPPYPTPPGPFPGPFPPQPPIFCFTYFYGGGIYCCNSNTIISNCTIERNQTEKGGGVCFVSEDPFTGFFEFSSDSGFETDEQSYPVSRGKPTIINCIIAGNTADKYGGGIFSGFNCFPTVVNCKIADNNAVEYGGGIDCGAYLTLSESVVIRNASNNGAGISCGGYLFATNCIIRDNFTDQILGDCNYMSVTYSNIQGGWEGPGNVNEDPLITYDGHLTKESPCIDAGEPNYSNPYSVTDIDGEQRIAEARIDIGIDEFIDSDGDGLPDFWELKYFGSPTIADPCVDDNNDGRSSKVTKFSAFLQILRG